MTSKHKKTLLFSSIAIVAVMAIGALTAHLLFGTILNNDEATYVYIDDDDDIDSVCTKVDAAARPFTMQGFRLLAKFSGYDDRIRTGRYEVTPDLSMLRLFRRLRNHEQQPVNIVVPSVRTIPQLAGRLADKLMIDSVALVSTFCDTTSLKQLGYTKETLPALFIPNTYEVRWDISADDLLQRFAKENQRFWTEERSAKANQLGLTHEEVVTLASIVDSESAYSPEKPTIAGLYLNRLHKGMLLQSDPTVIFAIGDFSIRRVLGSDLSIDSPYNTYKYKGLPPGPIRIATIDGIDAVLNAQTHDFLYMCAKEDFSGSHNFATTYSDHLANARRYVKALNERNIKR